MKNYKNQPLEVNLPLVTVGITSYNYEQYIEAALNSLLAQTYHNIEVIIIDDCSQDNCNKFIAQWIEKHQINCTYIKHTKNIGITRTLNEIVDLANGKYITFLATDDIMLPERVEKQATALEKVGNEYGLCYANALTIDELGNKLGSYYNMTKDISFYDGFILDKYLKKEIVFATPTMMLRTNVFDKVGLFDTRVLIEDFNFFVRLLSVCKVKYITYPCIFYRQKVHTTSAIHELVKANNRELFLRDRIISNRAAMKFTKDETIRRMLKNNIRKALNHLAHSKSRYYFTMLFFLLTDLQFTIPIQSLAVRPKVFLYKLIYKK